MPRKYTGELTADDALGPDGGVLPPELESYPWSQASREKGEDRRPDDMAARPYETVKAVANRDGTRVTKSVEELLQQQNDILLALYNGLVLAGVLPGDEIN